MTALTIKIDLKALTSKRVQLIVTLVLCGLIILSGTFAWFSVTQNVRNEFFGYIPRVNLHDDFNEPNKDIYVENTSGEPVLVRVKLLEYMEWGPTSDPDQNKLPNASADRADTANWFHHHGYAPEDLPADVGADPFHNYWSWTTGGQKWYVPATDAQASADAPGTGETDGRIVQDPRTDAQLKTAWVDRGLLNTDGSVADNDLKALLDDLDAKRRDLYVLYRLPDNPDPSDPANDPADYWDGAAIGAVREAMNEAQAAVNAYLDEHYSTTAGAVDETRRIRQTRMANIYTMAEWIDIGSPMGDFWVIDADGWAYWASPLESGSATGLLVDSVTATSLLNSEIRDRKARYYYAIDVSMQAATAEPADMDDPADCENYTGFWRHPQVTAAHEEASGAAQTLLEAVARAARADGSGGVSTLALETQERGVFWYQANGVWQYDDGRWTFDGEDWLLEGEYYPFDESKWTMTDGEWWYWDDVWYFNGDEWYQILQDPAPPEETPGIPPDGQVPAGTPPAVTETPPVETTAPPVDETPSVEPTVPPATETPPAEPTVPPATEAPPAEPTVPPTTEPPPVETEVPPTHAEPPAEPSAPPADGDGQNEQAGPGGEAGTGDEVPSEE